MATDRLQTQRLCCPRVLGPRPCEEPNSSVAVHASAPAGQTFPSMRRLVINFCLLGSFCLVNFSPGRSRLTPRSDLRYQPRMRARLALSAPATSTPPSTRLTL